MNRITDETKRLADEELAWAVKKHGYFHSLHEGFGVLKEEESEALDEVDYMRHRIYRFWEGVTRDDTEEALKQAKHIAWIALLASAELIQVSAVAQKIIESEGEDGKRYWKEIRRLAKEVKP